ncbi:hypothetical protein N878_02250 [Pseudomonas sp. EGD-AK9]|nr:hypothetical protein N878_02250 [Pseudomonas sp. EGD-AK9]
MNSTGNNVAWQEATHAKIELMRMGHLASDSQVFAQQ